MRLAVLASHPIQYQAPIFRELARRLDVEVFFAHTVTPQEQADAGFGAPFDWDVDLQGGYANAFLQNISKRPSVNEFFGCDTPDIAQNLREGRFDALLVCGWGLKCYMQGIFAARRLGIPVLVRGDSHLLTSRSVLKTLAKEGVYRPFLRLFDAALYVGQRSRAYYIHYGYPAKRLHFSPHCVDTDWFANRATAQAREALRARLSIDPDTRVVLFAGKLIALKRPLDLIGVAAACRSNGQTVEVMVAGDGPMRAALVDDAQKAGVRLHMLGFCNQSDMPAAYAASDCLALPSACETWGLVANEALACGRPILVSEQCGCAPDLASDGHAGRTFRVGDIHGCSLALSRLLNGRRMKDAIATLSSKYSVTAATDGIEAAIGFCRGQGRFEIRRDRAT